ncbi:nucleotidyl transferase, partial [Legionella pneumophila]
PLDDAETFRLDEHHYLLEIGKKTLIIDEIQGQYMGFLKFSKEFWRHFFSSNDETINLNKTDMTSFLQHLILKGYKIKAIANYDSWGEIDQPEDIDAVMSGF